MSYFCMVIAMCVILEVFYGFYPVDCRQVSLETKVAVSR